MRFVCDSCRAQYMISDEKVGAKGVKVRCKKCGFVITVRKSEPANEMAETQVMTTPVVDAPASATSASAEKPSAGDGLFSGVDEDEIGAVFDQVLGGGPSPAAPAAASEDEEFQSTRVVDATTLKKLAGESSPEGEAESVKEEDKASAAQHEWYVAIDEKQSGPLTLEKIKDLWDRGEIGADNLCWRAGFSDWLPLSEVGELAAVVSPKPAKPVISSNAHVSPALNAVADASDDSGPAGAEAESEWQPSAASALASLVKDEIEALTRPAPKKSESAPMAPIASISGPGSGSEQAPGLIDAPLPPDPFGDAPTVTRGQALPAMPPGGDEPTYTGARPSSVPPAGPMPAPTFTPPPYAYSAPPAQSSRKPMMIAFGAGGVVLVALMMVIVFLLGRGQQPAVAQAPATIPVQRPVTPPTPPVQVATAQPAQTQPAPANAVVPASTTPSSGTPTPAVATTQPPKAGSEQPAQQPKAEVAQSGDDSPKKHERHHRGASDTSGHEVIAKADPEPKHEAPPPPPSPKKGGDDFDAIFGGGGDSSSGSSQPAASASNGGGSKKHSSVYVPPAPGGADIPDTLEQSDIMKVVLDNKPAIVKCVNEQKAQDPSLSGRLVVRWTILTSGHTSGVTVRSDEFKRTHMASCIAGLVKGWKFPRHKSQGDPIDFPFTF